MSEPKTCFVIGPIGSKFAPIGSPERESYEEALEVLERVITPACEKFDLDPVRADQIASTGEINQQIFRHLRDDDVVIADLSGANANVMYELGLRHTRPFLTIQLGEYGQLPFDITAVRTIQFSRSERGLIDARKALEKALEVGISGDLEAVTATRLWNETLEGDLRHEPSAQVGAIGSTAEGGDEVSADESAGFLEEIVSIEERFPVLNDVTEQIGEIIQDMGQLAESSTAELNNAAMMSLSTSSRLSIVARFGQSLQPRAERLLQKTTEFSTEMKEIDSSVNNVLTFLQGAGDIDRETYLPFLESLQGTARASRGATEGLTQFESSVSVLSGMSKTLRRPIHTVSAAVGEMLASMALADAWETRAARVLKDKYNELDD